MRHRFFFPIFSASIVLLVLLFPGWMFDEFFGLSRSGLFRILVSLFCILLFIRGFVVRRRGYGFILFLSSLLVLLFVFSTVFSLDPFTSLIGTSARGQGMITEISYVVWFILLLFALADRENVFLFLRLMWWVFALVVLIGFFELLAVDVFSLWVPKDIGLSATFGHPAALSGFLVTLLPIMIVWRLFFKNDEGCLGSQPSFSSIHVFFKKWHHAMTFIVVFLSLVILFFTETRGAWFAFIASVVVFSALFISFFRWSLFSQRILRKPFFLLTLFLIVVIGFIVSNRYYVKNFFEAGSGTGLLRMVWWERGWSLMFDRWLFGHGFESAGRLLFQGWDPVEASAESLMARPDRFHNTFLDMAISSGIVSVAVYSALFCYAFFQCGRYLSLDSDKRFRFLIMGFISSLTAFLGQSFFIFSGTVSSVVSFSVLALVFTFSQDKTLVPLSKQHRVAGIAFTVMIFVLVLLYQVVAPILAHWHLRQTQLARDLKPALWWSAYQEHSVPLYRFGAWLQGGKEMEIALLGGMIAQASFDSNATQDVFTQAWRRFDSFSRLYRATFESLSLEMALIVTDPAYGEKHEALSQTQKRLAQLSPAWYESYFLYAQALIRLKDYASARRALQRAYIFLPRIETVAGTDFPWILSDLKEIRARVVERLEFVDSFFRAPSSSPE